jgi:hypothetical protein
MPIATLAALLLASGVNSMVEGGAVDAFVQQLYAPYHGDTAAPSWDRGIWSRRMQALLDGWKRGRKAGGGDDVDDADMLCDCQDWSGPDFRVETLSRQFTGPGRAVVLLRVWPVARHSSQIRLALVKEQGRWLIDELGDPGGRNLTGTLLGVMARQHKH